MFHIYYQGIFIEFVLESRFTNFTTVIFCFKNIGSLMSRVSFLNRPEDLTTEEKLALTRINQSTWIGSTVGGSFGLLAFSFCYIWCEFICDLCSILMCMKYNILTSYLRS